MIYYDDDYEGPYDGYEEHIEPVNLVAEDCTEKDITDALLATGLISEKRPKLICNMEKLVYVHGDPNEVYSLAEIRFTESIDTVYVYSDFFMNLNKGSMACRVIAARICCDGYNALKACVSFEKIIDKALDGFNIFFFVTEESVLFGCKIFDKTGKSDCTLSRPIMTQMEFEQIQDELSFLGSSDEFMDFYNNYRRVITCDNSQDDDYEMLIIKRRGLQFAYLDEIDNLGRELGVDMIREKERYRQMFEVDHEVSFEALLEEVEDSLSFIKSNRVNTYEMLFEADEIMRKVEKTEAENDRLAQQPVWADPVQQFTSDVEIETLLSDPEEKETERNMTVFGINNLGKAVSYREYFQKELEKNVKDSTRVAEIIDVVDLFGQYAYEKKMVECNFFLINDVELLKSLLRVVKTESDIRKIFRGKLVLLECGLTNYISCVGNKNCMQIQASGNQIDSEKVLTSMEENNYQGRFVSWCESKAYKKNTIKGFVSSLYMVELFFKRHGKKISIWTCDSVETIQLIMTQMLSYSDYKKNSQAHYLYALRVYLVFVKGLEFHDKSEKENTSRKTCVSILEESFEKKKGKDGVKRKRKVEDIRNVLKEYSKVGLYLVQLSDMANVEKDTVKEILENAPWCKKEGNRFYYNESADEWRDILYENDTTNSECEDEEYHDENSESKEYETETINDMLRDPDKYIKKRIKELKGD